MGVIPRQLAAALQSVNERVHSQTPQCFGFDVPHRVPVEIPANGVLGNRGCQVERSLRRNPKAPWDYISGNRYGRWPRSFPRAVSTNLQPKANRADYQKPDGTRGIQVLPTSQSILMGRQVLEWRILRQHSWGTWQRTNDKELRPTPRQDRESRATRPVLIPRQLAAG